MEKQELKSKWDDLAREIGAEISPEAEQREQEVSAMEAQSPPPSRPSKPTTDRPLPKREAVDWDHLATDLGLPPGEQVAQKVERQEVERERLAPPERPPARESQPRPAARERRDHREPAGRREPAEKRRERPERPRRDREDAHRARRSFSDEPQEDSERQTTLDSETPPSAPARPREESPKPAAAVSLWHKIFGSPTDQTPKISDIPTESGEPSEVDDLRDESREYDGSRAVRSLSGEDVAAADFVEEVPAPGDQALADEEGLPSERQRGRSRRRRRGGRGRKRDDRPGERQPAPQAKRESHSTGEFDAEFDDVADDLAELAADDDDAESEQLDSDTELDDTDAGDEATRATRTKSASQRAIPSWNQAIGYIVDSNMQSRSQRRPPSRSDSRGRPRGRRKK